jgi:hypothetical protein
MRLSLVSIAAALAVVLMQTPASAGGWWSFIYLPSRYLVIGQEATARDDGGFETIGEAKRAISGKDSYYAYLLSDLDQERVNEAMGKDFRRNWWTPPADMRLLGELDLRKRASNLVDSRINFEVPDVAPGRYHLMFCTVGCETPLGWVVPATVRITDDARLVQDLRHSQDTAQDLRQQRRKHRKMIHQLESELQTTQYGLHKAEVQLASSAQEIDELTNETQAGLETWVWVLTASVIASFPLVVFTLRRRTVAPGLDS